MSEKSSERKNINRGRRSSFDIHSLTQLRCMSEKGSAGTSERGQLLKIIFMFSGFIFAIGAHSISEEVAGFSPLWFPQGKSLCLLPLVITVVHVILSNKILDHID